MVTQSTNNSSTGQTETWFGDMIDSIKVDQLMYHTDTMHPEKKQFFDNMMQQNWPAIAKESRRFGSQLIIPNMLNAYLNFLKNRFQNILKLAFEMSDSKILVWAEIKEDDVETEDLLLIAEAKVNAEFTKEGFRLLTTIVEDCDSLPVPENFKGLAINKS